jgi:hypothetical protein
LQGGLKNLKNMKLNEELSRLKSYYQAGNTDEFEKQAKFIRTNFTTDSECQEISKFTQNLLSDLNTETEDFIKETTAKMQLLDVVNIVSLSYIAKNYFNKTRGWLYQKLNGNLKNGKPAYFSSEELNTFNFALKDISNKIGSITIA